MLLLFGDFEILSLQKRLSSVVGVHKAIHGSVLDRYASSKFIFALSVNGRLTLCVKLFAVPSCDEVELVLTMSP